MALVDTRGSASGIPEVRADMRCAEYWVERLKPEPLPLSRERIAAKITGGLLDLDRPDQLKRPPLAPEARPPGFRESGRAWSRGAWEQLAARVQAAHAVGADPAVTVTRASLRAWPTDRPAFRHRADREFDQWQVTRVHTMEPVRILAETADGRWCWVASRIAAGWVPGHALARTSEAQWTAVRHPTDPVVVVGSAVATEAAPYDGGVSGRPLEFGAWMMPADDVSQVGNQDRVGHLAILYPVRDPEGRLSLRPALVKDDGRVSRGFLAPQRASLLRSVFTQLGDRYDWGDRMGHHDCSSLVMDAYRTIGVQIPRNSGVQSRSLPPRVTWTADHDHVERLRALKTAEGGDLLHMPGHVLMYLGEDGGIPYAIHAFVGYGVPTPEGVEAVLVNAVEVSPVTVPTRRGPPFLDVLTGVSQLNS